MKILAIDPGSEKSAYTLWDGERSDSWILDNQTLLDIVSNIGPPYRYTLVIEQVKSYGMPVGETIFETVFWSGRFAQAYKGSYDMLPRMDVKMHLCKSPRANDSNIRQALIDRFGEPTHKAKMRDENGDVVIKKSGKNKGDPKMVTAFNPVYGDISKDMWASFAVAVTYYDLNINKQVPGILDQYI